ncbi:MAG: ABC transporter substrate-binding protein [Alicyclobacillus sp.]|nr:ABC transporter substrate-binding protein [Alicyclobacillus sp.]
MTGGQYPQRIVCLAAEIPEILHELGALDRVVGISAYTTRPREALSIPKVSGFQYGSVDRILATRPQLAILTSAVQRDLARELLARGIPVLHLNPHRLSDVFDTVRLMGSLVGAWERAEALCRRLQAAVEEVSAEAARLQWRPRVYFEEWMDPLVCGCGWVSDVIEIAGGRDIFRDRSVEGRSAAARTVDWEDVVRSQPDIMLASWCGKPFRPGEVLARPRAGEVPAVRRSALHELTQPILQCGIGLADCLREVHGLIRRHVDAHAPEERETGAEADGQGPSARAVAAEPERSRGEHAGLRRQ